MSKTSLEVEASGETVGEAKWMALRELERLAPGLDRDAVEFQVVTEGRRGLLGVGTSPARVIARIETVSGPPPAADESDLAALVRETIGRIVEGMGLRCRVEIEESAESLLARLEGGDLGLLIGRRGQTIDAVQLLVNAIARQRVAQPKPVEVDAAGYRERRRARLEALAVRSAKEALASGREVELEPMSAPERKLVHTCLKDYPGIATRSEGDEPYRRVVVVPAGEQTFA